MEKASSDLNVKVATRAYLWNRILGIPFFAIFEVFIFILLKELQASTWEITAVLSLRPISALLAPYWSSMIHNRQDLIKNNLLWANFLRYMPFLFFPIFNKTWLFILAIGFYWVITQGMTPAWMEVVKQYLPKGKREKLCSKGLNINYLGKLLIPVLFGILLDKLTGLWIWIFPITAMIGIFSSLFIFQIPTISVSVDSEPRSITQLIQRPWRDSLNLLTSNSSFKIFQKGFFLGGAGLMLIQPAISLFFVDELNLSYTTMATALTMMKGVGFIAASSFWVHKFKNQHIFQMCIVITSIACAFPLLILSSYYSVVIIYFAYFLYGVMQSGSELAWNMSGPVFSQEESSSAYSTTNLLAIGVRGVVFPYLGALIFTIASTQVVLLFGSFLIGSAVLLFYLSLPQKNIIIS